jgi:membrane-associated protein
VFPFTERVLALLPLYGPWLLCVLAFLETCFITGLVVPAGVATALGTVLALDGELSFVPVVGAALAGGALGDTVGYWVGRASGERILMGEGRWARRLRRRDPVLQRWFGRHPAYSVSAARVVAFVRTVMPLAAGMSRIRYLRFLAYDLVGLAACVGLYVGIGALARESWEAATRALGIGGAAALLGITFAGWWTLRRRVRLGTARRRTAHVADDEDSAC